MRNGGAKKILAVEETATDREPRTRRCRFVFDIMLDIEVSFISLFPHLLFSHASFTLSSYVKIIVIYYN